MANNQGKSKALLGVLIVLIIPFLLITIVYLSTKPNIKSLPKLSETSLSLSVEDLINSDSLIHFNEDIKVIYPNTHVDEEFISLIRKTLEYPKRTFKDRHSKILFIFSDKQLSTTENGYLISNTKLKELYNQSSINQSKIILLDQNNIVRGEYSTSPNEIVELDKDLQFLMIETFSANSKNDRIFKR